MAQFVSAAYKLTARPLLAARSMYWLWQGFRRAQKFDSKTGAGVRDEPQNDLQKYFDATTEGPGIWKWRHYFDIYSRHFEKFRGKNVNILEIGIYSGGSLGMWRDYFGPKCKIFGVDIKEECKNYEESGIKIFIGDQADREFWARFKADVGAVDIVIDDGGHEVVQQVVTLEELWPILRPGGVYLCEDVHFATNSFSHYMSGLTWNLNSGHYQWNNDEKERRIVVTATPFQSAVHSVHLYPFAAVVEKRSTRLDEFVSPMHGSEWQPPNFWTKT
ncbi:MAG: class I SAM-dependent methyltransferase [Acetobacteraceae bacterium]|nr:class I SAM-dependent methyltransferase [Acetobacteraceae bacterium]